MGKPAGKHRPLGMTWTYPTAHCEYISTYPILFQNHNLRQSRFTSIQRVSRLVIPAIPNPYYSYYISKSKGLDKRLGIFYHGHP